MDIVTKDLQTAILALFKLRTKPTVVRPDYAFGDYSTNIAFELVKKLQQSPDDIANKLKTELLKNPSYQSVDVVKPGFLNLRVKDTFIIKLLSRPLQTDFDNKIIVSEYSDPNPFKQLHVGHLFTSIVGDAIANLLSEVSPKVYRVNFGGDIGLHVAINIFAILKDINNDPKKLAEVDVKDRSNWLGEHYMLGHKLYKADPRVQNQVKELNKQLYSIAVKNIRDTDLAKVYWITREWSYDSFKDFYRTLKIRFDKYYPESSVAELGLQIVTNNIGKVFEKSNQAVIFDGSKHNVNTYVFIDSRGLPTYSAKDVGLIFQKWQDFKFDYSIIISGNEQSDYMNTVLKSVAQINPELSAHTIHLTNGLVKGPSGAKFSSRLGNAPLALDLINETKEAFKQINNGSIDMNLVRAAIKYSFLKQRYSNDIIFDPKEAVSLEGKSGPYLLYAYVRGVKILNNSPFSKNILELDFDSLMFEEYDRKLAYKASEFNEVLQLAINELKPHHLANYLFDLAQIFNVFYENVKVLGSPREELLIGLIIEYLKILKKGLNILGIDTTTKM